MTTQARIAVFMKPLAESKSRLTTLDSSRRQLLTMWMLSRVLLATRASNAGPTTVIGGDEAVQSAAERLGVAWLPDAGRGLNDAVATFLATAEPAREYSVALPADLPTLGADDLNALLDAAGPGVAVVAPDKTGRGTNGLVLPTGHAFEPAFGLDSFVHHGDEASKRGLAFSACRTAGLQLDIDEPEDLEQLIRTQPTLWGDIESQLRDLDLLRLLKLDHAVLAEGAP